MSLAVGDGRKLVERAGLVNHLPVPWGALDALVRPSSSDEPFLGRLATNR